MSTSSSQRASVAALALCLLCAAGCQGDDAKPVQIGQHAGQVGRQLAFTMRQGLAQVNYLLFLPQEYGQDPERQWPLLVFLHGLSKRGDTLEDLDVLKRDGPPRIVEEQPDFPFIVLSPQCPSDSYWEPQIRRLEKLAREVVSAYSVDADRVYLTGLSMGGYGAWHWALEYPNRFAAVVPIAGGHIAGSDEVPGNICDIKDVPIWAFHGDGDDVVLPWQSEVLVEALRGCGSEVRFTLYPGADHDDSWKQAYADAELYEWMLEQER